MTQDYKIYGAELSPYSVKVRSFFRFKKIPHKWIIRNQSNAKDFQKFARLPIVPLVVTPDLQGLQDSTPIMDHFEENYPEIKTNPERQPLNFLSYLLEEYSDEWGNKQMFHYRWKDKVDQKSAALRIAENNLPTYIKYLPIVNSIMKNQASKIIQNRMSQRLWVIGSNEVTENQICDSYEELLSLLEAHLSERTYIFGERPSFADFGLWGQIYNSWTDPTPRKFIEKKYKGILPWINEMMDPKMKGDFEAWESLSSTLMPILKEQVGKVFLPWSDAVTKSMEEESNEVSILIKGKEFTHSLGGPQKYHVKSLKVLRKRFQEIKDKEDLKDILSEANCLEYLIT